MELRHRSLDREHGTGDLRCFCRESYLDGNSNLLIRATKDIVQGRVAYQSARLTLTFPGCHAPVTPGLFSVGWFPASSSRTGVRSCSIEETVDYHNRIMMRGLVELCQKCMCRLHPGQAG